MELRYRYCICIDFGIKPNCCSSMQLVFSALHYPSKQSSHEFTLDCNNIFFNKCSVHIIILNVVITGQWQVMPNIMCQAVMPV